MALLPLSGKMGKVDTMTAIKAPDGLFGMLSRVKRKRSLQKPDLTSAEEIATVVEVKDIFILRRKTPTTWPGIEGLDRSWIPRSGHFIQKGFNLTRT